MKTKRIIFFRVGTIAVLLVIAALMMLIGRGHTVYFDSVALDYNGETYATPYKIVIFVGGEEVAKLYDDERGMTTCVGQKLTMTFEITQEKGGEEQTSTATLVLPYNMDGIAINLPAYLAGLPEEVYLSKFQSAATVVEESPEEVPADEFGLGGDI